MASRARVDLTDDERTLLVRGLYQWGGPAIPTDEIAQLLGFTDADAPDREGVLARRIESGQALEPSDWRRALLATEIVFASDLLGAGVDWSITTRFSDEESIRLVRSLQRKLARVARLP